jgi:hypothetical protein
MKSVISLAILLPLAASAQIALSTISGGVETAVGAALDLGKVAAGDTLATRIRLRNRGTGPLTITQFSANGTGLSVNAPSVPFPMAAGTVQDIQLNFSATLPASYSATLQVATTINTVNVIALASVVLGPVLTVLPGCTGADGPPPSIDFGSVQSGQSRLCNFSLQNANALDITIAAFQTTGLGFQISSGPHAPFTIPIGGTISFAITFTPNAIGLYPGSLGIGTRSYVLTGAAFATPFPTPLLEVDTGPVQSAQQRQLTMRLPTAASVSASGFVNLAFLPDTTLLTDDPAVVFLATGTRSLPFSISQETTQITINGKTSAMFQTGTTSGRIRFTISGIATAGDATTVLTVPASGIALDTATATRRTGDLDVQLIGFDNTYSAGSMAFTFFDTTGKALSSAISADFTKDFQAFFTQTKSGSAFQVRVSFPVTGDTSGIGSVDVRLSNSKAITTQHLVFQ